MATDKTINIIIDAQNRASGAINSAQKSIGAFNDKLKSLEPAFKTMAVAGTAAFAAVSVAVGKTVKDALQFQSVQTDFNRMVQQIGVTGDKLLSELNRASGGTVANVDLMLTANRALALGVGNSMEDISKLMEIARVKGRALGLDTTQAFNDIVTGIGRGSPLILDNLGIITKGWQEEADAAGVAMDKNFILNKILSDGTKELEAMGEVQLTAKERMQQLNKQFQDASAQIGAALVPALTKILEVVTPIIEKVAAWVQEHPKLTAAIVASIAGISALAAVIGTLGIAIIAFQTAAFPLAAMITAIAAAVIALIAAIVWVVNHWQLFKEKVIEVWNSLPGIVQAGLKGLLGPVMGVISLVKLIIDNWGKISEFFKNLFERTVGFFQAFADSVKSILKPVIEMIDKILNAVSNIGGKAKDLGKKAFGKIGDILGFDTGGVVPGPKGSPQLAMVHGGETILPTHKGNVGMGGTFINVSVVNPALLDGVMLQKLSTELANMLRRDIRI